MPLTFIVEQFLPCVNLTCSKRLTEEDYFNKVKRKRRKVDIILSVLEFLCLDASVESS